MKTTDANEAKEGAIEFSIHGHDLPILCEDFPRVTIQPKVGDLVMFPSSLFHRTIPFQEKTERCVIAFDVSPIEF